jgi:hypothetical protein
MKKQKSILIIIAISVSLLFNFCVAFAKSKEIKGDGKLVTKSISISNFSKIEIETYVVVNYSQKKNSGNLEFTVDNNLWEYYNIYTEAGVLYIKLKKEYRDKIESKPTTILVTVSSEQLKDIEIAGNSKINFCTPFTTDKFNLEMAGSGKILMNKYPVNINRCSIEDAGSGNIQISGKISEAHIEMAGSGCVKALDCEIAKLDVEIAGSATVEASVTDKLSVEIAGSGKVNYKGNPKVNTDIAGSGKVKKL